MRRVTLSRIAAIAFVVAAVLELISGATPLGILFAALAVLSIVQVVRLVRAASAASR